MADIFIHNPGKSLQTATYIYAMQSWSGYSAVIFKAMDKKNNIPNSVSLWFFSHSQVRYYDRWNVDISGRDLTGNPQVET